MKKQYLRLVRQSFRTLRHPHLRHRKWWQSLTRPIKERRLWIPCRDTVATGLSVGAFYSMFPILPFQMLAAALSAMRLRANIPTAMAACWISNPLTTPPILYGQAVLGQWMENKLGVPMPHFLQEAFMIPKAGEFTPASLFLGMFTSAVLLALLVYPAVHLFSAIMPHHLPVRKKRQATP